MGEKWHPASGKFGIFGSTSGSKQARKATREIDRMLANLGNRRDEITSYFDDLSAIEDERSESEMLSGLEQFLEKSYNIQTESEETFGRTNLPTIMNRNTIMAQDKIERDREKFLSDYRYESSLRDLNLGQQRDKELFALEDIIRNLELTRRSYS
jgi:hypothetical protein|tara:strand:+ start:196 stop:660 length:465 start_codon:yes stop_codon:yes gene_type:complete